MNQPVPLQVVLEREGLATLSAAERPLAAVDALVGFQAPLLREALPTRGTSKRTLPGVNSVVLDQVCERRKPLPTDVAAKALVSWGNLRVYLDVRRATELFATLGDEFVPSSCRKVVFCVVRHAQLVAGWESHS